MTRRKVWQHDNDEYRNESAARLRELFPVGTEVPTVIRHVTQSGMGRVISVLAVDFRPGTGENDVTVRNVSHDVARVVGWQYDDAHNGVYVTGAGMDMAFHVVYTLSTTLYRDSADEPDRAGYSLSVKHL